MLDKSLSNTKVTHTYIISNSQIYNTILAYIMEQVAEKLKVKILESVFKLHVMYTIFL